MHNNHQISAITLDLYIRDVGSAPAVTASAQAGHAIKQTIYVRYIMVFTLKRTSFSYLEY